MSSFNSYARKLDTIAKNAFEEYLKAETAYKDAKAEAEAFPLYANHSDPTYMVKSTRAHANYTEAKEAYNAAKRTFDRHKDEVETLRKELEAEINEKYSADPSQLDRNTLDLLKSQILQPSEYEKLLNEAAEQENATMVRLIGKFAQEAADSMSGRYNKEADAKKLRVVSYYSRQYTGGELLEAFNSMADTFSRCVSNPALITHWSELTENIIENF